MQRLIGLIVIAIIAVAAVSCQQTVNPAPRKELSFAQYVPINLNVANIEVVEEYKPTMTAPHVDHFFPTTPSQAMHIWVKDRLRATGRSGTLQVIIKDASAVETKIPVKDGIKGAFNDEQSRRYDAKLEVEMRIYTDRAISDANINVMSNRSRTLEESASLMKRDQTFTQLTQELMDVTNAELEKNITQYFANYINYSGGM